MKPEKIQLDCPFCGKGKISVIHIPSILQSSTSHAAGKTKSKYYYSKEKYEVQSPCPKCGKSAKEIQKALDEGVKDPEKDKKILKRLKEQGLDFSNVETKF